MTNTQILEIMFEEGQRQALDLQSRASSMTGTEIIEEETKIPNYSPSKDYSAWTVGSPVIDEDQVWQLIQPHNAANYSGRPSSLRALWGLCHTTNPAKAKSWVDPYGTSGMYMKDECYKDEDGIVWRANQDNLVYDAKAFPDGWIKEE